MADANDNSVTCLITGLKAGDGDDIQRLWDRYFGRLVRLAGSRLPQGTRRAYDEEDVALSAFRVFCEGAGRGLFPRLEDRDDLWRVLATITTRKLFSSMRHQTRQKRGGGNLLGESALVGDGADLSALLSREPTPHEAAAVADEYDRLFARLDDPVLQDVARRRLEGQASAEIAAALGTSVRTVDRKLSLVRAIWEEGDAA